MNGGGINNNAIIYLRRESDLSFSLKKRIRLIQITPGTSHVQIMTISDTMNWNAFLFITFWIANESS